MAISWFGAKGFVLLIIYGTTMFSVVEFAQNIGGGLALVHEEWFTPRKTQVAWPPVRDMLLFNKVLRKGQQPDSSWKLYDICRIFYKCDNLDRAREKLKQAELTSDLNSEEDDAFAKKKRKITKRVFSSSESEDDETSLFLRPPKIISLSQTQKADEYSTSSSSLLNRIKPVKCSAVAIPHSISPPRAKHNNYNISQSPIRDNLVTPRRVGLNIFSNSRGQEASVQSVIETHQSQPTLSGLDYSSNFQKKVIELLTSIKEQNNEILQKLDKNTFSTPSIYMPNLPVSFPITTNDNLLTLEKHLQEQGYEDLSSFLASVGGKDVISKTNRILKLILSDELASLYSFFGKRNEKFAFGDLVIKKCIIQAIKIGHMNSKEADIENAMKVWLKHAPQRCKRRK